MAWIIFWCSSRRRTDRISLTSQSGGPNRTRCPALGPCKIELLAMKQILGWALDTAMQRGASFADARIVDDRSRALATKNGKVSHASDSESLGLGMRVIADGAWGFAASDDLSREAVEATAARALAIAKASA